jgi:hypothetical protein
MALERQDIRISNRIYLLLNPEDSDTPALVHTKDWKASATYTCVMGEGVLMSNRDEDVELTPQELKTLDKYEDLECQYNEEARKDCPEYQ